MPAPPAGRTAARKSLTEALPPGPDLPWGPPSNPVNLACPRGLGTGREAPLGSDSASRPEARPPRGNLGSPTLSLRTPGPGVLKERETTGALDRGGTRCGGFPFERPGPGEPACPITHIPSARLPR